MIRQQEKKSTKMNFLVRYLHKTGNHLCFCAQISPFYADRVEIDWKWNHSLWSRVRGSVLPACWQSTASIKARRGTNSGFRIRIKEEGDGSGGAGGQKDGNMEQNEYGETANRKERRSTPAGTGRDRRPRGDAEIKGELWQVAQRFSFSAESLSASAEPGHRGSTLGSFHSSGFN